VTRVQFELNENQIKELKSLMKDINVRTKKDLFNNSLSLLKWVVREMKTGRTIGSINEKGDHFREIVMPFFSAIKKDE